MSPTTIAVIVSVVATYAGLVTSLVLLYVRTLRSSYEARVTDLKDHNAEMLTTVRAGQDVGRLNADSLERVLASTQTMEALMRALPVGKADAR